MRSMPLRVGLAMVLVCVAGTSLTAQSLPLPRSSCKLSIEGYTEYVESYGMQRVFFEGCLTMQGDPARLFYRDPNPAPGCAIQFYYDWDREIKLQVWVYEDSGQTAFSDQGWNALMQEVLEGMRGVKGELTKPFDSNAVSGTPMLGFVSLDCQLRLTAKKGKGATILHRYCLVPVPERERVLLVGFHSGEKHFDLINAEFERFVRSLHRRP